MWERSERRRLEWTSDFARSRKARVSKLDFETKPLDPTSRVKSRLGKVEREKELRSEIGDAYLSDLRE